MSRRAVVVDRWDEARFAGVDLRTFRAAGKALMRLAPETGTELWADLFAALDLAVPRLVDAADMEPGWEINHGVIATVMDLPELRQVRIWTAGDSFYAAMACVSMRTTLEIIYDRAMVARRLREALEAERTKVEDLDEAAPERAPELLRLDADADELAGREAEAGEQARVLLQSALRRAADEAEAEDTRTKMWAAGTDGFTRMSASKRLALAKRMQTPAFAAMGDLFGAMETLRAIVLRDRIPGAPSVPGDVEYGRDLTRVLPSAVMRLADDDLALLFLAEYADGRLPMLEMIGTEEAGRGGLIVCCDTSVSMSTLMAPVGTRDLRAKAMALLLLHQAREQGRPYYSIVFSERYRDRSSPLCGAPQLMEFDFTQPYTVEQVLAFAECFFGGGTSFSLPLDRAVAILEAEFAATGHTESDVVFITDGEAVVTDAWVAGYLARMHRIGARTWGLLLAGANREPLATICEGRVASFDEITRPDVDLVAVMSGLAA